MKRSRPEAIEEKGKRVKRIYSSLRRAYPQAHCTLDRFSSEQFLLAAILSPQCTDITTNRVSKELWKRYPSLLQLSQAPLDDIADVIRPCGMYRIKSKYIKSASERLLEVYHGVVPDTLDELLSFSGVGRKVALVVLLEVFGNAEGIIIDTHNIRLANRLGLSAVRDARSVENDLMKVVPERYWKLWSHLMVFHGRACCTARAPRCSDCAVLTDCLFENKNL